MERKLKAKLETLNYWVQLSKSGNKLPYVSPKGRTGIDVGLSFYLDV